NSSGLILASGSGAHVDLETTVSGGTLKTSGGAVISSFGAVLSGVTIAPGSLISALASGGSNNTLQLFGTIVNSGTITLSATGTNMFGADFATLDIGDTTLTGGGKILLAEIASGAAGISTNNAGVT